MKLSPDQLEYSISQYLDGTLNPVELAAMDELLATDAEARAVLDEYRRLNLAVKSGLPVPEMAWDELAASISASTAALDLPVRHYQMKLAGWSKIAALAAVMTIVVGAIVKLAPPGGPGVNVQTGKAIAVNTTPVDVQISAPPAVASAAITQVEIGQPAGVANADYHSAEAIISSPSSIWIASGESNAPDGEPSVY